MGMTFPSRDQMLSEVITKLRSKTTFTALSPGAKARALLEIFQDMNADQVSRLEASQVVNLVRYATGKYLDYLGEILGISRLSALNASMDSTQKVVRLYPISSNFGSINSNLQIYIPAGTELSASNKTPTAYYETIEDNILLPDETEKWIGVRAKSAGASGNVDVGQINTIDFTNYSDYINESLLVSNDSPIVVGRDKEDDDNFRYRIVKQASSLAKANETAIRLAALSVPGVAEVVLERWKNGVGTCRLVVQTTAPIVPDSIVTLVRSYVAEVESAGCYVEVTKPRETGVQLEVTIQYSTKLNPTDISTVERNVALNIRNYVDNLNIGEGLYITELVQRIHEADTRIKSIGSPNKPIDALAVYQMSRVQGQKVKRLIDWNYEPLSDEKIIMEPSIDDPIVLHSV